MEFNKLYSIIVEKILNFTIRNDIAWNAVVALPDKLQFSKQNTIISIFKTTLGDNEIDIYMVNYLYTTSENLKDVNIKMFVIQNSNSAIISIDRQDLETPAKMDELLEKIESNIVSTNDSFKKFFFN